MYFRPKLEWGWNAHAETYCPSAKVSQKGAKLSGGGEAAAKTAS